MTRGIVARTAGHDSARSAARTAVALLLVVSASACASTTGTDTPTSRWDRPTADLSTLTLDPRAVRLVRTPGDLEAQLAIGSIFVRHADRGGYDDALGLLVVVEGESARLLTAGQAHVRLEVDHATFDGDATPRGVLEGRDGRATFLVPVTPELLASLVGARTVRGRIGTSMAFVLPPENRVIFREFLERLPADAFAVATAGRR